MAKGKYTKSSTYTFINPYNFVGLPKEDKQTKSIESIKEQKRLTGSMTCTIHLKTPLAVPDVEDAKKDEKGHVTYFFLKKPDGSYFIPGSSIRGVIRNVYETATNSCFSTMRDETRLHMRSGSAAKPGILKLEDGIWKLYKAKRYMLKAVVAAKAGRIRNGNHDGRNEEVWDGNVCPLYIVKQDKDGKYIDALHSKWRNGESVHFEILTDAMRKEVVYQSRKGYPCAAVAKRLVSNGGKEGILVLGEDIYNKHHESIFVVDSEKTLGDESQIKEAMKGLEKTAEVYRNESINRMYQAESNTHFGYYDYEKMKKQGCIPVWYQGDGKNTKIYLQFASIGRKAFQKTLNDHVDTYQPCKQREELCKACRLFGMAGEDAVGSRVRFSDAVCTSTLKTEKKTLAELGTPRASYLPFYAKIEGTYDKETGYDDQEITIRGRKFYWHSTQQSYTREKTKRNATMELMPANSTFSFQVYYDGVTEEELQELVWSINFWENSKDGHMCHKMGHGKPLGLGSAKITVDKILERTFSEKEGYVLKDSGCIRYDTEPPMKETDKKPDALKELKKICDYGKAKEVCYPYVVLKEGAARDNLKRNDLANHQWFTNNKGGLSADKSQMQKLPHILDDEQELYAMEYEPPENDRGNRGGNNRRRY